MKVAETARRAFNLIPILLITFYRKCISPLFPPTCRFHPSCSAYGLECFEKHDLPTALWLTCWRILRCNPFNPGGVDQPPEPKPLSPLNRALRWLALLTPIALILMLGWFF